MKFTVRRANLKDAGALAHLYLQFWTPHECVDPLIELKQKITIESETRVVKKIIAQKGTHVLVAELDGTVIGFIEFLIKNNDGCFRVERYGYLNAAATDEKYRGKGVARALTDGIIDFLRDRGIRYLKVNVYNSNYTAMEVWQRMGFQPLSTMLLKDIE